ncbi:MULTISPECIES: hypothetical protein [Mycolicibacterium]|nr:MULTISPECIES: hypothetical protein [Mycolicibacterium]QZT58572.1 hypothetical protein JN084_08315 [Mycolicibacterium austroafricanum]
MPHHWEIVFFIAVSAVAAIAIGWAFLNWRRTGDKLPFAVLAGGAACSLAEPVVITLGQCWYPTGQLMPAFTLMGNSIPLFAVVGYTMAFGAYTVFTIELLKRKGPKVLWRAYFGAILFTGMFEIFAVTTKSYVYYGEQPLRILDFPLWWGFVNALVPILAAVILTACRPWLTGWRLLFVIPALPTIDVAAYAPSLLTWLVLKSDVPTVVMQLAGIITCALAVMVVYVAVEFASSIRERQPLGVG